LGADAVTYHTAQQRERMNNPTSKGTAMKITPEMKELIRQSPLTESARLLGLRIGCSQSAIAYYRDQFRKQAGKASKPAKKAAAAHPKEKALATIIPSAPRPLISLTLSHSQIDEWWAQLSYQAKAEVLETFFSIPVAGNAISSAPFCKAK
jgi:hypothetical protein